MRIDDHLPPGRIAGIVTGGPDHVRFPSATRPWIWIAAGIAAGLLVALVGAGIATLASLVAGAVHAEELASLAIAFTSTPAIFFLAMGGMFGFVMSRTPRNLTVTRGQLVYDGLLPPADPAIGPIRVDGVAGRPMILSMRGERLAVCHPSSRSSGWDYASVTWLADRIGELLGQRVDDNRPAEDWRRWETDPLYRAQKRFDHDLEDNRKEFPTHHRTIPEAPKHKVDLEGMTILLNTGFFSDTIIKMTPEFLILEDRKYPLDQITRAGVKFRKVSSKNSTTWYARLYVLVGESPKSLARMKVSRSGGTYAGHMLWTAQEIQRMAETASGPRDRGSVRDIPDEMKSIRRSRAADGSTP